MRCPAIPLALMLLIATSTGCDSLLPEEKPTARERHAETELFLRDGSGYMERLYGTEGVPGAEIVLRSNTEGREHRLISDDEGYVTLAGLTSDTYHLSVVRPLSADEMQRVTGVASEGFRLRASGDTRFDLRADVKDVITVAMDLSTGGSPLVISEIYGAGPPGAGLYFHDKYVEFYNQSDSVVYLDGLLIATAFASGSTGENFINDPHFVHSQNVWQFPGSGTDYPIEPGAFVLCASDAIDHRVNAPESVDLSGADFEFYKDDAPDIDNPDVTNMVRIHQPSGNDWLIGGERDALILSTADPADLSFRDGRLLIPLETVLDGVEYLQDPSRIDLKKLSPTLDAGAAGGIRFYSGRSIERLPVATGSGFVLKDDDNSALDFRVNDRPTPGYHYSQR